MKPFVHLIAMISNLFSLCLAKMALPLFLDRTGSEYQRASAHVQRGFTRHCVSAVHSKHLTLGHTTDVGDLAAIARQKDPLVIDARSI